MFQCESGFHLFSPVTLVMLEVQKRLLERSSLLDTTFQQTEYLPTNSPSLNMSFPPAPYIMKKKMLEKRIQDNHSTSWIHMKICACTSQITSCIQMGLCIGANHSLVSFIIRHASPSAKQPGKVLFLWPG